MRVRFHRLLAVIAGTVLLPANAFAACTVPAGIAGDIVYNSTYNVLQFCNGTTWINAGSSNASGIGTLTSGDFCTTDGTNINCTTAVVAAANGGTGVANSNNITLGGNVSTAGAFTTSGANSLTLTTTGATNVTLPTSGTLVTTGVTTLSSLVSVGTITTGIWNGTAITVPYGGTGVATLASNGVLYGNGTSAIQVTAQGAANSVLTANAGAPSFSASPTVGTSVTTPLVIGGTAASSTLTLESTSGSGTSDVILFKTASQSERMRIDSGGNVGIGTTGPQTTLDVNGFFHVSGCSPVPTTTVGVDIAYCGGEGNVIAYDRGGSTYKNLHVDGTKLLLNTSSGGNVGIGTAAPTAKLAIANGANAGSSIPTSYAFITSGASSGNRILTADSNKTTYIQTSSSGAAGELSTYDYGTSQPFNLLLNANGGNVGIGTNAPQSILQVAGAISDTAGQGITFGSAANRWAAIRTAQTGVGAIVFDTYSGSAWNSGVMTLTTGGNVGIGTASPSEKLDMGGGNVKMGYEVINQSCTTTASGWSTCTATCSAGKQALGGSCTNTTISCQITDSTISSSSYQCMWWTCGGTNSVSAQVACANIK